MGMSCRLELVFHHAGFKYATVHLLPMLSRDWLPLSCTLMISPTWYEIQGAVSGNDYRLVGCTSGPTRLCYLYSNSGRLPLWPGTRRRLGLCREPDGRGFAFGKEVPVVVVVELSFEE